MTLCVCHIFLAFVLTIIATLFLAFSDDNIAIFFSQAFPILVRACVDLPLGMVDSATVATTFTWAAASTVSPTVVSNSLNTRKNLVPLIIWRIGYNGCEMFIRLQISNAVKFIPNFKRLECVL